MRLESKLAMLVHGARADTFCTIGMPLNRVMDVAAIHQFVRKYSIDEAAEYATTARIILQIMSAPCMRAMVICVDELICRVITACTCTPCHAVDDTHHDGETTTTCIERFDSEPVKARAHVLSEMHFQNAATTERLVSPLKRTEPQNLALTRTKLVEAISAVLTTLVGPNWPEVFKMGVDSLGEAAVAQQIFTPLHVQWRTFLGNVPRGARAVQPPSNYPELIKELNRIECYRIQLLERARQRDDQKELLFWEELVAMSIPLNKLYEKISMCIDRNAARVAADESKEVRVTYEEQGSNTAIYAALDAQLRGKATKQWQALRAEVDNAEVAEACRIEESIFKHEAKHKSDQMLGYFVYNTQGILRHMLYNHNQARASFQQCFERVYYTGQPAPSEQKETVDRMFQELQITMLKLSYKKASYKSVGRFHRNRVMIEFLCSVALQGEGTTREKNAAMAILRSGFCFVTGTPGLHKLPPFLQSGKSRLKPHRRVAASYTLDEAEESMRRRSNDMQQCELLWSRRAVVRAGGEDDGAERRSQGLDGVSRTDHAWWRTSDDPSFAFTFETEVNAFDEEGQLLQSNKESKEESKKVDVDNSVDGLFGRAPAMERADSAAFVELQTALFQKARRQ